MLLKARLKFEDPISLAAFKAWLTSLTGFDEQNAMVRIAKTTGQRPVLIIEEERNEQPNSDPAEQVS